MDATKNEVDVYKEIQAKLGLSNVESPTPNEIFFILGGEGAGKGVEHIFNDILVEKYRLIHLSTYDIVQDEIKKGAKLG